jgi:hypothetical protein
MPHARLAERVLDVGDNVAHTRIRVIPREQVIDLCDDGLGDGAGKIRKLSVGMVLGSFCGSSAKTVDI